MKPIIALDADGVLLDYHLAYRDAWKKAFGQAPAIRDPMAYWPVDRWDVRRLADSELELFRACFDESFWSNIPPIAGAVDACNRLHKAGFELVCVTAMEPQFQAARVRNLRDSGFPIDRVIVTTSAERDVSPKAEALHLLRPIAFVDDFLPYLRGISPEIHSALVLREPHGSPNVGHELHLAHSRHVDLSQFASWWLVNKKN